MTYVILSCPTVSYIYMQIGTHGIQIEFPVNGSSKTATYLPEISHEQGWTKLQAIDSLLHKGGYRESVTEPYRQRIKLTRYQSEKSILCYDEYVRLKRRIRPY